MLPASEHLRGGGAQGAVGIVAAEGHRRDGTLLRPPSGTWLSLHATTALDDAGGGTTTTLLGDERGRLGVAVQTLFVAPRESLASRR